MNVLLLCGLKTARADVVSRVIADLLERTGRITSARSGARVESVRVHSPHLLGSNAFFQLLHHPEIGLPKSRISWYRHSHLSRDLMHLALVHGSTLVTVSGDGYVLNLQALTERQQMLVLLCLYDVLRDAEMPLMGVDQTTLPEEIAIGFRLPAIATSETMAEIYRTTNAHVGAYGEPLQNCVVRALSLPDPD